MEECIICFEPTDNFFIFTCTHKSCYKCAPLIINKNNTCPICETQIITIEKQYIVIPVHQTLIDNNTRTNHYKCCQIYCSFFIFSCFIFYLINYTL